MFSGLWAVLGSAFEVAAKTNHESSSKSKKGGKGNLKGTNLVDGERHH